MPWWRWWKLRNCHFLNFSSPPDKNVSIFSITWEWEDFIAAFQAWQNWAPYIDERLTSSIELFAKQRNKIEAQGEFVGSPSELHSLLSPLLETGSPSLFIEEVPYIKAVEFLMEVTSLKILSALVPMSINLFP